MEQYRITCYDGECRHSAPLSTATAAATWLKDHVRNCRPVDTHEVQVTQIWAPVDARALPGLLELTLVG